MTGDGAPVEAWTSAAQCLAVLLVAPGIQGLIARLKAMLQGRHGPGVLQPYFTLAKLWRRQDVRPEAASWIFTAAPGLALAIVAAACLTLPLFVGRAPLSAGAGLIVTLGLLALLRFVVSLSGLDTATPFGGLGSSRESAVGALIEPALFALALPWMAVAGSTAWPALLAATAAAPATSIVRFFGLGAAMIVLLAETGRLPIDNPDTHLELTMIHEAMVLEYAGPQLALMTLAHMVKQLLMLGLVADLLLPWGTAGRGVPPVLGATAAVATWCALATGLAVAETLSNKLRFFRLPAYLGAAAALSSAAAVLAVWGVR